MSNFPLVPKQGDTIYGRLGKHTLEESPNWQEWQDHVVTYVQGPMFVVADLELVPENYEGNYNGSHIMNVGEYLFEFKV